MSVVKNHIKRLFEQGYSREEIIEIARKGLDENFGKDPKKSMHFLNMHDSPWLDRKEELLK